MTESPNFEDRLAAVVERIHAHREAERLDRELRDRLVVEAVDAGHSWATVARWADISNGHIHRVLAKGTAA